MNIVYLKNLMVREGYLLDPSPDHQWGLAEENAWRGVCEVMGARFTPYPDRNGQDITFLDQIDQKILKLPIKNQAGQSMGIDLKQLLPLPIKLKEDAPAVHVRALTTIKTLPKALTRKRIVEDHFKNLEPNENAPVRRLKPTKINPMRAQRMKQLREGSPVEPIESVDPKEPLKTVRVRGG